MTDTDGEFESTELDISDPETDERAEITQVTDGVTDMPQESFEELGIYDEPRKAAGEFGQSEDIYTTGTLDKTYILEEGGGVHTIAERMAELEGQQELPEDTMSTAEKIGQLKELRDSLLGGHSGSDVSDEGFQKVKTR